MTTTAEKIAVSISILALCLSIYTTWRQHNNDMRAIEATVLSAQIDACTKLSAHHYTQENIDEAVQAINAARALTDCLSAGDIGACRRDVNMRNAGQMCIGLEAQ
ncbi:hypothetical protein [Paracoccus zhejiangensis]|uniref:hypothetical protein n=1 Tax=Paracoccus zhejiangensis TaxID=1077935 RepID=UPI0012FFE632|nr:hypothetical protein [Paracoccus zhejiangensis]